MTIRQGGTARVQTRPTILTDARGINNRRRGTCASKMRNSLDKADGYSGDFFDAISISIGYFFHVFQFY